MRLLFCGLILVCLLTSPPSISAEAPPQCSSILTIENVTNAVGNWDRSFKYNFNLKPAIDINKIELLIVFDEPVYAVYSIFGIFNNVTDRSHLLVYPEYHLKAGQRVPIELFAWYEWRAPHATLVKILLNGATYCGDSDGVTTTTTPLPIRKVVTPPTTTTSTATPPFDNNLTPMCNDSSILRMVQDGSKQNRYTATVKLQTSTSYKNPTIWVRFDRKIFILINEFASHSTDSQSFRIDMTKTINSRTPYHLRFSITYNILKGRPQVQEIKMDSTVMCRSGSNSDVVPPNFGFKSDVPPHQLDILPIPMGAIEQGLPDEMFPGSLFAWLISSSISYDPDEHETPDPSLLDRGQCTSNHRSFIVPKILHANQAEIGQFPWHVAIYLQEDAEYDPTSTNYTYKCGGSLVTRRAVITAAHCVSTAAESQNLPLGVEKYSPERFMIYLGLLSIQREMGEEQRRKVAKIVIHSEYEPMTTYYSDIAVMRLAKLAKITETVVPICLFTNSDEMTRNQVGLISGWGLNENGTLNQHLGYLDVPIVPMKQCRARLFNVYKSLTDRQICAGQLSTNGVCNGDSGGGLAFSDDGKLWRLRGIVSITIGFPVQQTCDPQFYTVYTDVNKFLPWIRENVI